MYRCVEKVKPNAVVHLGDYYDDAEALAETYPHLIVHQVAGNCDKYRCPVSARLMLCYRLGGVMTYMTHGHLHRVKSGEGALIAAAKRRGAQIALFGHTHSPLCEHLEDGMWLLNPGSCGYFGGSAGMIVIENGNIAACRLLRQADLEEMV